MYNTKHYLQLLSSSIHFLGSSDSLILYYFLKFYRVLLCTESDIAAGTEYLTKFFYLYLSCRKPIINIKNQHLHLFHILFESCLAGGQSFVKLNCPFCCSFVLCELWSRRLRAEGVVVMGISEFYLDQ